MAAVTDSSHILLVCCHVCPHKRFSNYYSLELGASSYPSRVSFDSSSRRRQKGFLLSVSGREISDVRVTDSSNNVHHTRSAFVEIPVTCYQILGIPDKSEKDEIVKSMNHLKFAEIEEGYTMDTVVSRQNLLMDVRDKLLFEADYAGNVRAKVPPKSSLQIPWSWLPSALCLLQEVGEEKLALDIGRTALQHPDSKPFVHDLLLSMALAECAIAKANFEKNKISQGFEALARAQSLLKSKPSLEKMTLLSQIEESLEELAPACTLELLGMPHTPENAERRVGAIAALRELLRQGLDVETSCQVEDWPCFLNQALNKLTAAEIVELLNWDSLANTRKNKKSLESQNQRIVVDASCLYVVMMAHMALGFSSKQIEMIKKAKTICECLLASEGIDLRLEEAFCLFLLGQGDEAVVVERLRQVESNSNLTSRTLISGKDIKDASNAKKMLESWLNDALLGLFPDTRDCSPSLDNFFGGEKRVSENKHRKRAQTSASLGHRSLSTAFSSDRRTLDDHTSTSPRLEPAVKQLTPSDLHVPLTASSVKAESYPAVQLKRNLGVHYNKVWEVWLDPNSAVRYTSLATVMLCLLFATFKLMGVRFWGTRRSSSWVQGEPRMNTGSLSFATESSYGLWGSACNKGSLIADRLSKMLSMQNKRLNSGLDVGGLQDSSIAASSISSATVCRRSMHVDEAETLVKQWQTIKAEALGPNYKVHNLVNVLDESMLRQWKALAETAKDRCCFWRFVLLQLSILRADILSDGMGKEMAEIEALVEEAAELVDASHQKNPNYYSTYTIRYLLKRQDDGSWRFCESDIQTPS
ncbi:plastid division protein CDP1, chloroplastic [Cynara cardunculus var. scolymus]|uniref:plastid division protein CDP1, chloroplastic n=1 Tax=Cynara cardunculus var. scolymus TaxID=59895 RepID=UPI000D62A176|nr:plastid division protein CDP1, chloroplastic [Cynara cardunculus var. scolymus]XP_024970665.1 plastid division protein CDP1, chloroplastic [Cynara cardunculus var. scolymus]